MELRNFDAVDSLTGAQNHHIAKYDGGCLYSLVEAQLREDLTGSTVHKTNLAGCVGEGQIGFAVIGVEGNGELQA